MGITFEAHGERCSHCGEVVFDWKEVGRQEQLLGEGLVARGIRTGVEFTLVRKYAGFKATEIAELFDVRPETISRWESGALPVPRLAAFALGELFQHPRAARAKLETLAHPLESPQAVR